MGKSSNDKPKKELPKVDLDRTGVFISGRIVPQSDIAIDGRSNYVPRLGRGDKCLLYTRNSSDPYPYQGTVVSRNDHSGRINVKVTVYDPNK